MKLYSGPLSMFGAKAEIAVLEKGVVCERELVPFSLATLYEPKHPEVLRINPKAQVPVLIDGDIELFDSTQIFEYLEDIQPEPALWPREPRARARARRLELESDEVFFPNVVTLFPHNRGNAGEATVAQASTAIAEFYTGLERRLASARGGSPAGEYLVGQFSYADIAFYMASTFAGFIGAPVPDDLPRLTAWRARVGERASVRQVVGAMLAYVAAARGEASAAS
jgi:glutathione S-transferase